MKKYEVNGRGKNGVIKPGEGKCITYPLVTCNVFATSIQEAEKSFLDTHPECDLVLDGTYEVDMTPTEAAKYNLGEVIDG